MLKDGVEEHVSELIMEQELGVVSAHLKQGDHQKDQVIFHRGSWRLGKKQGDAKFVTKKK
jgi:hypothetical protein